jgi:glycerol-3-phosphate acyltransferase PlsX
MRIAVDAMGSDRAPYVEVHGAVVASMSSGVEVVLVGDGRELKPTLAAYRKPHRVSIMHASEVIRMDEPPAKAVRQKKDSSLLVALRLVKEGEVDGIVSAGNTGAVMVAARTVLGPIKGVARSAICQALPTRAKPVLMLDLGANVDCTARHLCEFAEMGMVYSQRVFGVSHPRVGLLNIGEEQVKGNEIAKAVHAGLSAVDHIHFIGNVEPRGLYQGVADVVVCDGFVGNLVLKTSESVASLMTALLKRELSATWLSQIGALLSLGGFRRLKRIIDPNEYIGAPLLGVNGNVILCHGASSARGITNAIQGACKAAETAVNDHIREGIARLREHEAMRKHLDPEA